jgi:hypothetical protein
VLFMPNDLARIYRYPINLAGLDVHLCAYSMSSRAKSCIEASSKS